MSDKIARMKAEVALLEAEEEFTAKKASGKVSRDDKDALRALREAFRTEWRQAVKNGAAPEAINTKVGG